MKDDVKDIFSKRKSKWKKRRKALKSSVESRETIMSLALIGDKIGINSEDYESDKNVMKTRDDIVESLKEYRAGIAKSADELVKFIDEIIELYS